MGPLARLAMIMAWRIMEVCLAATVRAMKPPMDHLMKQDGDREEYRMYHIVSDAGSGDLPSTVSSTQLRQEPKGDGILEAYDMVSVPHELIGGAARKGTRAQQQER